MAFISGLAHINVNVQDKDSISLAPEFWVEVLGMKEIPVPHLQKETLKWFEMPTGQQVHISIAAVTSPTHFVSSNHPCFKISSPEALRALQLKIYEHHMSSGSKSACYEADAPGVSSGAMGVEYPRRFFARDFAGNRLEFSL